MAETKVSADERGRAISAGKLGKTHRGVPHSEETKRIISEKTAERMRDPLRNPFLGKKRSEESRKKQSETRSARIVAGDYAGWFKKGMVTTQKGGVISFKSSWEEDATRILDSDPSVVNFEYEPVSIPYMREEGGRSNIRHYIPDFLVSYLDGRHVLIEVKPQCFVDAAINVAKFAAARRLCEDRGWEFQVWTQEQLGGAS